MPARTVHDAVPSLLRLHRQYLPLTDGRGGVPVSGAGRWSGRPGARGQCWHRRLARRCRRRRAGVGEPADPRVPAGAPSPAVRRRLVRPLRPRGGVGRLARRRPAPAGAVRRVGGEGAPAARLRPEFRRERRPGRPGPVLRRRRRLRERPGPGGASLSRAARHRPSGSRPVNRSRGAARVAALLGGEARDLAPVSGGDICAAYRVVLADGRTVFAKTRDDAPADFFAVEAAGLGWLAAARGGVAVPAVLAVGAHALVLEGVAAFGADRPGYIGTLDLPNAVASTAQWPEFYAECRVLPYLRLAVDRGAMDAAGARAVQEVVRRLPELAGPPEPPSRVHGDLWSGNLLWGEDGLVRLVDPAAHGGHRETDLAMLALFGAPYLKRILSAYDEVFALATGWRERVPLHQLYPLLVHAGLFGGGY